MFSFSLHNVREKCHWVALCLSLFLVTGIIVSTILWPSKGRASYDTGATGTLKLQNDYQSPYRCRDCHADEFRAWSSTSHADASLDPVFQANLQSVQQPGKCFSCHTTGYDSTTGQFALAGVTCEACHGPYREGHPAESMMIAPPEELCGACHGSTLTEWASSRHGKAEVTCTACHEVHSQKIRSADNTNALCADCHQDQTQDPTHSIHSQTAASVYCIDCHLVRSGDDAGSAVKGQVRTGHSFAVSVSACDDCHPTPLQPGMGPP